MFSWIRLLLLLSFGFLVACGGPYRITPSFEGDACNPIGKVRGLDRGDLPLYGCLRIDLEKKEESIGQLVLLREDGRFAASKTTSQAILPSLLLLMHVLPFDS